MSISSDRALAIERDLCVGYVARLRKTTWKEILGRSRKAETVRARHMAIYLLSVVLNRSQTDVSLAFGIDRASVRHALTMIEDLMDDPPWESWLTEATRVLTAGTPSGTVARNPNPGDANA